MLPTSRQKSVPSNYKAIVNNDISVPLFFPFLLTKDSFEDISRRVEPIWVSDEGKRQRSGWIVSSVPYRPVAEYKQTDDDQKQETRDQRDGCEEAPEIA